MNKRIKELSDMAYSYASEQTKEFTPEFMGFYDEKFSELIIKDAVDECRQEWYDLNNAAKIDNETPRSIGIRIGTKGGVLRCIARINKHFGVK